MEAVKCCSKCKESKDISLFGKNKYNKDGLQYYCKTCRIEGCAASYQKISKELRDKRNNNTKEWRKNNIESIKQYTKKYKKKNKAIFSSYEAKRRATKLQQTPKWLTEEHLNEIQYFYKLAKFFQDLSGGFVKYHVDHIVPLKGKTVRGLHVPWNLTVLKATENCSKGNKYHG